MLLGSWWPASRVTSGAKYAGLQCWGNKSAESVARCVGAVMRADLQVDVGDVSLSRALTDRESEGDLFIARACGQARENLQLSRRKAVRPKLVGLRQETEDWTQDGVSIAEKREHSLALNKHEARSRRFGRYLLSRFDGGKQCLSPLQHKHRHR